MAALNEELNIKRHHLIAECAQQRLQIAVCVKQMQKPLTFVNTTFDIILLAKRHPWLLLGVLLFLKRRHHKGSKPSVINRFLGAAIKIKLLSSWIMKAKAFIQNASSFDS